MEEQACHEERDRENDVIVLDTAILVLGAVGAIVIFWLLAYLVWDNRHDRTGQGAVSRVEGVTYLGGLKWKDWTPSLGWPPETCWRGCKGFHRHDWWKAYQGRTCWDGCADLHRDDWWRAYVDRVDSGQTRPDLTSGSR